MHPPETISVAYAPPRVFDKPQFPLRAALTHVLETYDLTTDPYVMELRELNENADPKARTRLEKVQLKRNTWCLEQLSAMCRKSWAVTRQLGAAAGEWYISQCRKQYMDNQTAEGLVMADLGQRERVHLSLIFRCFPQSPCTGTLNTDTEHAALNPAAEALIETLLRHGTTGTQNRVVVFAEERAVVLALGMLLRTIRVWRSPTTLGLSLVRRAQRGARHR